MSEKHVRLKSKDIKGVRDRLLKEQDGVCPLCGWKIHDDPVLDHDHDTGYVRAVLHRQCNHAEGRIKDWIKRTGKRTVPVVFLRNLTEYIRQDYSKNPLHPNHKTEREKEILALKRKKRKVKRPDTKRKYQRMIQQLEEQEG